MYVTDYHDGGRRLWAGDLHLLPGESIERDTLLMRGEMITAIELPGPAPHSAYSKVRERASYEYAIVSAAVVLDLDGDIIAKAREPKDKQVFGRNRGRRMSSFRQCPERYASPRPRLWAQNPRQEALASSYQRLPDTLQLE